MQRVAGSMTIGLIALSLLTSSHAHPTHSEPSPKAVTHKDVKAAQPIRHIPVRDGTVFWLHTASTQNPTSVTDSPWGIVFLVPPGWSHGQRQWHLNLYSVPNGSRAISNGDTLSRWSAHNISTMFVAGVTSNYALVVGEPLPGTSRSAVLYAVDLFSGQTHTIWHWSPSLGEAPFTFSKGQVTWWVRGTGHANTVTIATGKNRSDYGVTSAIDLPNVSSKRIANAAASPHGWQTVMWQQHAVMAVPANWVVRRSDRSIRVLNPSAPSQWATFQSVNVTRLSAVPGNIVGGPPTPGALLPIGSTARWINDHCITYQTVTHEGLIQGTINVQSSGQGNIIQVHLPRASHTAETILQSAIRLN